MDLNKKLALLVSTDKSLTNPFDEDIVIKVDSEDIEEVDEKVEKISLEDLSIDNYLNKANEKKKKKPKKRKGLMEDLDDIEIVPVTSNNSRIEKKTNTEKMIEDAQKLTQYQLDDMAIEFDAYISGDEFESDENVELRNSLVSLGRKYTRDTSTTAESSEIAKIFSGSEKKLGTLYDEITKDKDSVQKDIDQMRLSRSRNFKTLSDLIESKNSFHSTQLSIIKEVNSIHKAQFELKLKDAKSKEGIENGNDISSSTIKNLFSLGKSSMIGSLGGYETISGAVGDYEPYQDSEMSDEDIQRKYFADKEETDGDKFLKYENVNVSYVLMLDDNDKPQDVLAEDEDGNIIYDYPMPSNIEDLSFDIDTKTNTARDSLHRNYKIRYL